MLAHDELWGDGRGFQLFVLTLAAMAAAYSKTAVGPLQEAIRVDLMLSDNQMALLQGPALALPMVLAALPLGLVIDRYSRVRLLLMLAVMNALCLMMTALTARFELLFLARCLAGLGAFATVPVVISLLADLYPPAQRGRVLTVMTIGQFGGAAAVFALGGEILTGLHDGSSGWRAVLLWLTLPLVAVAALVLALREPPRTGVEVDKPSVRAACAELWGYRALIVPLSVGVVLVEVALGAALVWTAPTLSRSFGLSPDRIGAIMGAVVLTSGILGAIAGGVLADVAQRAGGTRHTVSVLSGLALLGVPAGLFAIMPGVSLASTLLGLFLAIVTAICVMGTAVCTVAIPNELRGLCLAVLFAAGAILGVGFAPVTVSLLSDALGGAGMIGRSLAMVCGSASLLGAVALACGARALPRMSRDEKATSSLTPRRGFE
jgi:MFS family permease